MSCPALLEHEVMQIRLNIAYHAPVLQFLMLLDAETLHCTALHLHCVALRRIALASHCVQ